jgi:DNA-binding response OmpR family regulator
VERIAAKSRHVLIFDDDASTRELYRDVLEDEGYRVTLFTAPGLEPGAVARMAPELIVLDLRFRHEADGVRWLERLKSDPATRRIPVLVCSGDRHRLEELAGQLAAWDCGVLRKPFDLEEFLAAIRACVGQRAVVGAPDELQLPAGA